ncbi:uncharacterized protein C2845_PM05G04730 [Panicum miliaceum]|uniref:AIPP2-like SPOC-like domain-containing protein n=1 Tax=Panicum miliaceum TaxID=4540 RepID=A0A3L6SXZ8_PANMI|nr:uncharacterized protein C2845_PM05G04730 [Panicum miliaceum]
MSGYGRKILYGKLKVELPRPMIVCFLGYKLGDVDISKPMRRSARKAMKKHRIADTENYAEEVVETSDFNNLKFVEPIWSGAFVNNEIFEVNEVKIEAYLSSKACHKVEKFSRSSLPQVVAIDKVPRLEVWPKIWKSSGPTNACIGLYFFPPSLRSNEVSNELVKEIIESDGALKATVGIVDLLIFPSILLPEQNQLYQGKHYLWGVFKRRKGISDEGVIAAQQDGSASAVEEGQLQEQHLSNQQDGVQPESPGQETSAVKPVENEPMVEYNPETEKEAMAISMTGGVTLPGSSLFHEKPDTPTAGSNSSVALPEEVVNMQQEEGFTSSHELNASTIADPSVEGGGRGQSSSVTLSEPPTIKLFGVTIARTPKAQQQLVQEMPSEVSMEFSEELVAANSNTTNSTGVGAGLNLGTDHLHLPERPEVFGLNGPGGEPEPPQPDVVASDAGLELFPVQQEQMGLAAPGNEAIDMEVDLELSLAVPPSCDLQLQL